MKKCLKCKEEKPFEEFYRDKSGKDGRKSYCKECSKRYRENNREKLREYQKQWYENNREKIIEQQKQYPDNNKEKIREKNKQYFKNNKEKVYQRRKRWTENNKEKLREWSKQYYENNKEKERERNKQYRKNNKEKIKQYRENNREKERERQKQYQSQRRKNDPKYRLSNNISRAFRHFLDGNKEKQTSEYLKQCEYTREELVKHLEEQFDQNMTWDNYGSYWHVDHIIPQSVFEPTNDQHLKWCWSLENLRPLEASENASKQDDIILELVEKISYYEDVKHLLKD